MSISSSGSGYAVAPPGPIPKQPENNYVSQYALGAITPPVDVLTATTPNDGRLHSFIISTLVVVTVAAQIGGALVCRWVQNGVTQALTFDPGNHAIGQFTNSFLNIADPGTLIRLQQNVSLTQSTSLLTASIVRTD